MKSKNRPIWMLAAGLVAMSALAAGAQTELRSRTFQFTYRTVVNEIPAGAKSVDVWIPYPVSDQNQIIHQVKVNSPSGPVTIARADRPDGTENTALYYHGDHPTGPVEITLEVTATRRENAGHPDQLTPEEAREYLKAEPLVPLDGPVKAVAEEAVKGKKGDAQKAQAIYEKVTGMMKYDKSGTGWGRGDALFACDAKRGNCTDFHALIIGAARSEGIPARFAIGFPLPEKRGGGEIPGYHCWAELFVKGPNGGRWVPVDSSEAAKNPAKKEYYYGHHDENRIEFSRGRQITLAPTQKGAPLNFFIYPYVEVDGKKYDAVERKFAFADEGGRAGIAIGHAF